MICIGGGDNNQPRLFFSLNPENPDLWGILDSLSSFAPFILIKEKKNIEIKRTKLAWQRDRRTANYFGIVIKII